MFNNSNFDFLTPIQDEFLPPINRWVIGGGLLIVATLALAIPVASIAKYKTIVKAQALVRPTGELRLVQAATEGRVKNIFVQENQAVKKGDVMAIVDDSKLQTKKSQLQSQISQGRLQLTQINGQIHALDMQILAESDRSDRAVAKAIAELNRNQRNYQEKQITTVTEVNEAEANLKLSVNDSNKAYSELELTQADLRSKEAAFKAAQVKASRYKDAAEEGAIAVGQLEEAQLEVEQHKEDVQAQKATIKAQQDQIAQRHQAIEAAKARLERARATLNPTRAEVDMAKEGIAQEKATIRATVAILDKEKKSLIQQSIETQKQLDRDTRELEQVEIDLEQTVITATTDGIIDKLNLRNSGQTVRLGEEIAQIAPSDVPLILKATVPPEEIGKLKAGQMVQMRVSACPYPDYGTLKGRVSFISQDIVIPQKNLERATAATMSSNQKTTPFYEVTIEPKNLSLGKGKNQCYVQVGMEGRADIITREESVLQFVLRKARLITDL